MTTRLVRRSSIRIRFFLRDQKGEGEGKKQDNNDEIYVSRGHKVIVKNRLFDSLRGLVKIPNLSSVQRSRAKKKHTRTHHNTFLKFTYTLFARPDRGG